MKGRVLHFEFIENLCPCISIRLDADGWQEIEE